LRDKTTPERCHQTSMKGAAGYDMLHEWKMTAGSNRQQSEHQEKECKSKGEPK
jgi:hypothetical protein